jgi:YHS domain-containing protein
MKSKIYLIMGLALLLGTQSFSQNKSTFSTDAGAIGGYDAVAYFTEGKAIKGALEFRYQWNDVTWLFKNSENLKLFMVTPEKYAPQYGGYCAYGISENHKSPTSPDAFTIVNSKLYLNYNLKVKEMWLKNQQERIIKADSLWPGLKKIQE